MSSSTSAKTLETEHSGSQQQSMWWGEPFILKLHSIEIEQGDYFAAKAKARSIGEEVNRAQGFDGMRAVCDEIRKRYGGVSARDLEQVWNGFGEWRG